MTSTNGMAIRWTSIMAAVYVVDSDGAGHLRKITVSGTPRVDNIALSSDIAYGSLALVSVGTMLLCTSVISNVRVVALPNGNACSGGCTSATVVASSIGAYSGALGHLHVARRGTMLLSDSAAGGGLYQFQINAPRYRMLNTFSLSMSLSSTSTSTMQETVTRALPAVEVNLSVEIHFP